ncbi:MAG: hypothetical protein FWD86_00895 [Firmicutes bacterium]|nr:hypothetical protein [Bacillota bacterium]
MKKKIICVCAGLLALMTVFVFTACPLPPLGGFRVAFDMQKEWERQFGFNFPQVALIARADLAASNPALVSKVTSHMRQSVDFARTNHNKTAQMVDSFNSSYLSDSEAVKHFIGGNGQTVLNFGFDENAKNATKTFLTELHKANPNATGGSIPSDLFYFDHNHGQAEGEEPVFRQLNFYIPDGAPLIAAAALKHDDPIIEYSGRPLNINYRTVTGATLNARLNSGAVDFALVPVNLAAQAFNNQGGAYVFVGVALWGLFHIVENADLGFNRVENLVDMVGQTIVAYQRNMSPGVVLETVLRGLDLKINIMAAGDTPAADAVNIVYLTDNAAATSALLGFLAAMPNARFALIAEPSVSGLLIMTPEKPDSGGC